MKIQIRKSVFETNSSSVHTLTISMDKTCIENIAGKHIVFGKPIKEAWENSFQNRVNRLYDCILEDCAGEITFIYELQKFEEYKKQITDYLLQYGVTCEFNVKDYYHYYYNDCYRNILNSPENLVFYLFGGTSEMKDIDRDYLYEHNDCLPKENKNWVGEKEC